jgi:hypothetical protein
MCFSFRGGHRRRLTSGVALTAVLMAGACSGTPQEAPAPGNPEELKGLEALQRTEVIEPAKQLISRSATLASPR